jgi:pimeloyl-ACP methyl ester carboxylesterase
MSTRSEPRPLTGDPRARLLAKLPLRESRIDLAGIDTAVLEGGLGPPLVLLHGPGEFGLTWLPVISDLAGQHRLVIPDLPGHGASRLSDAPLDAARMLDWLDALLSRTCPTPPAIAGHLLGGALALRFATARPDRVSRLVLVDTFGLAPLRPAAAFALAMAGFVIRPNARTQRRLFDRCFTDLDGLRARMAGDMELLEAYALQRARTPELKRALRQLMPRLGMPPIPPDELAAIGVPTTLIHGREDLQVRLAIAERAAVRYGWPLHVIDGAADDPAVEQPAAFLAAMHPALARTETETETKIEEGSR